MPITSSAKDALRKDRRRTITNAHIRSQVRTALKKFETSKDSKMLPEVYSILDRATKKRIIHKHKAARIKSKLTTSAIIAKPTKPKPKSKKTTSKPKTTK